MVVFGDLPFDFRVYREAHALARAGHRVSLVAPDFGSGDLPEAWGAFEIHRTPIERGQSLRRTYPSFWRRAARMAVDTAADVFHAHDLDALWPAARAATRRDAALVYDSHELFPQQSSLVHRRWIRGFWQILERRLIRRVDRVVTVSQTIARCLEERHGLARPAVVVRNVPPYREPVVSDRLRRLLDLARDPEPLALYQGGFLTDNGLSEQIEAMRHVRTGRLVLLGGGPTEPDLRRQVETAGLKDRVRFLDRVPFPELHELTCGADVGLCVIKPTGRSFLWSMPNKLFEYFMAGIPVLAGDTPEIRTVVEETEAGVLVDPIDPAAIARTLGDLLSDGDLRVRLAAAARSAAQRFCWEREAPRLLEVYESL